MTKPPIGPASPPRKQVRQIVIELDEDDGMLRVKVVTKDAIQTLGMLRLAEADVIARLSHTPEENRGGKIIIPNMRFEKA